VVDTRSFLLAVLLGAISPISPALACPTDVPSGLRSEPVGEELVTNGLPMTIRQVTSKESSADLLDRIEHEWKDASFAVKRQRVGQWDVLSARGESCNTTLQLIDRNGAFGYFGVSQPAKQTEWLPKHMSVKLPGNIQVNSSVSSTDGGRKALTVAFSTRRAVSDIDSYFLSSLSEAGWKGVTSHEIKNEKLDRARIVTGQKGREQLSIVLWTDGITRALMNISEAL
jgi:hypothetical protein